MCVCDVFSRLPFMKLSRDVTAQLFGQDFKSWIFSRSAFHFFALFLKFRPRLSLSIHHNNKQKNTTNPETKKKKCSTNATQEASDLLTRDDDVNSNIDLTHSTVINILSSFSTEVGEQVRNPQEQRIVEKPRKICQDRNLFFPSRSFRTILTHPNTGEFTKRFVARETIATGFKYIGIITTPQNYWNGKASAVWWVNSTFLVFVGCVIWVWVGGSCCCCLSQVFVFVFLSGWKNHTRNSRNTLIHRAQSNMHPTFLSFFWMEHKKIGKT